MSDRQTLLDWSFALQWVISCAVGTAVFGAAAYGSMWWLGEAVAEASREWLGTLVAGVLFGAFLALGGALGPGFLLRSQGISAGRWIGFSVLATAVAMSSGVSLISFNQIEMVPAAASVVFVGLALGLPMGLVQWLLLKQQRIQAVIWPLITTISYILAFGIVVFFSGEGREWIVLGGMGLVLGAITGLGMMWLLRQETAVVV